MIDIIKEAAREGGTILRSYFREEIEIQEKKSIHDIVTIADKEAQKVIVDYITKKLSEKGISEFDFIGEEQLHTNMGAEHLFIIDPLDGTSSYAAGLDYFCVSIAYAKNKEIMAGVIYDVSRDCMYSAVKGEGAYKNDKRLALRQDRNLKDATILLTTSSNPQMRSTYVELMDKLHNSIRCYRLLGSVALDMSHVVSGVGDVALNTGCNIWDVAASALIVREAGGEVLQLDGQPMVINTDSITQRYSVMAGNKELIHQIISLIK